MAARAAFSEASKNAGDLGSKERRQLQDFMQNVAAAQDVQLASGQEGESITLDNELPITAQ